MITNSQFKAITADYEKIQNKNRHILLQRKEEIYARIPAYQELEQQISGLCIMQGRKLLSGDKQALDDMKKQLHALSAQKQQLLKEHGYPADYLEMSYTCPLCQDTGYVGSQKCACFKKAEIELLYTQSNLKEILEKENFDHFSFDFYSDTITNDSTGLTERETAHRAYKMAKEFVADFDNSFQNLFFYGDTGVGKTFLSHCIAHDLLDSAHCVLYFSSFELFDFLAGSAFSRGSDAPDDEPIFDCDLLIIDDLGTELTNSFVSSQLFLCINERIMRKKSTIISTNLKLEDFSATYSERTFSRIASNYQMTKLVGKDIRIQKIFLGGK